MPVTPTGVVHLAPESKASNIKIEVGSVTTVTATDVVQTKLKNVRSVVITPQDDPVAGAQEYSAVPGSNGQFTLKGWKATATADTALIASTTFGKKVTYMAVGE